MTRKNSESDPIDSDQRENKSLFSPSRRSASRLEAGHQKKAEEEGGDGDCEGKEECPAARPCLPGSHGRSIVMAQGVNDRQEGRRRRRPRTEDEEQEEVGSGPLGGGEGVRDLAAD